MKGLLLILVLLVNACGKDAQQSRTLVVRAMSNVDIKNAKRAVKEMHAIIKKASFLIDKRLTNVSDKSIYERELLKKVKSSLDQSSAWDLNPETALHKDMQELYIMLKRGKTDPLTNMLDKRIRNAIIDLSDVTELYHEQVKLLKPKSRPYVTKMIG